jgi:hypothetical protein
LGPIDRNFLKRDAVSDEVPVPDRLIREHSVNRRQWLIASAFAACATQIPFLDDPLFADEKRETFVFQDEKGKSQEIIGQVLVEAVDGSLLLQGNDSRIWRVSAKQLQDRPTIEKPFVPISKTELGKQLLREMGPGFLVHATEHYVLCTNTSEAYARWCGVLFERLAAAFQTYWTHSSRNFKIIAPEFPLVALIFEQQPQFAEFATTDVGPELATVPGYFSILTNRIVLYDFAFDKRKKGPRSAEQIEERLNAVSYNVATMIHEATHQIAFNYGMHTRLADNPLWLTEGMATFFETPDLKSKTGWKTAGQVNKSRLKRWKEFLERREADSLTLLIRTDERLTTVETAVDAYAESWAFTYFLIRKKPAQYVKYLTFLAAKKPLEYPKPEERVAEFEEIFGAVKTLDVEFLRYAKTVR